MVGWVLSSISNNLPNQIAFNVSRNLEHKTRKCRPDNTQHIAHGSGNTETRTVREAGQLYTRVERAVVTCSRARRTAGVRAAVTGEE